MDSGLHGLLGARVARHVTMARGFAHAPALDQRLLMGVKHVQGTIQIRELATYAHVQVISFSFPFRDKSIVLAVLRECFTTLYTFAKEIVTLSPYLS